MVRNVVGGGGSHDGRRRERWRRRRRRSRYRCVSRLWWVRVILQLSLLDKTRVYIPVVEL